jgi:probable rRNA maturation factor
VLYRAAGRSRSALTRAARRFLKRLALRGCELSVLVVGDGAIRQLNRRWRRKDAATDVLSFPADATPAPLKVLGDVVISYETAQRRAKASGTPVQVELDRYLAHGLLHLLGYDHARRAEAREMAAREEELLRRRGLVTS